MGSRTETTAGDVLRTPDRIACVVGLLLILFALPATAVAKGPTIDEPGKLKLDRLFGGRNLSGPSVLDMQPLSDSSVLVATSNLGFRGESGAAVAKLTAELGADSAFGSKGVLGATALGVSDRQTSSASALIPLADGDFLVAGTTGRKQPKPQLYVSRRLADGSADPDFGDGGTALLDPTGGRERTQRDGLVLQPDGSIVLAFRTRGVAGPQLGLVRLDPDGALDPSFGDDGTSLIPTAVLRPDLLGGLPSDAVGATYGFDLASDSRGRLAVVTSVVDRGRRLYAHIPAVVRLGANGSIRGETKLLDVEPPRKAGEWTQYGTTVEFDRRNRIIVGGGAGSISKRGRERGYFAIYRLRGGGLDRRFGDRGRSLIKARPGDLETGAVDLTIAPGGRILAAGVYAGETREGYLGSTAVVRFRKNGKPDRRFGEGGFFGLRPQQDDGRAIAIDPEGRILAAGTDTLTRLR